MQKLKTILFYLLAAYLLPVLGKPELLWHWQLHTLMLTAVVMILSQPALDVSEARARKDTDRHSMLWISVLALPAVIAPVAEWAYCKSIPPAGSGWTIPGLALIAGGLAFRIWAIRTLGRAFTSTVQVQEEQRLVSTGPYRLLRHPSYLGAYVTFLGCAVFLEAWVGLVIAAVSMGIAYAIRIPAEERVLQGHFGSEWEAYCGRVRWRMAPRVW